MERTSQRAGDLHREGECLETVGNPESSTRELIRGPLKPRRGNLLAGEDRLGRDLALQLIRIGNRAVDLGIDRDREFVKRLVRKQWIEPGSRRDVPVGNDDRRQGSAGLGFFPHVVRVEKQSSRRKRSQRDGDDYDESSFPHEKPPLLSCINYEERSH